VASGGIGGEDQITSARGVVSVDAGNEARTIGRRLRQIRKARDKSLKVVAGLFERAGCSAPTVY